MSSWIPALQSTVGVFLHTLGIEPSPTYHDSALHASVQKVQHIHRVTTQYEEDREQIKDSIIFLDNSTEETYVDPKTPWGQLSPHQRRRILYKKRLDLAYAYTDPTTFSDLDNSIAHSLDAIESAADQGLTLAISRTYSEPLLFHSLNMHGKTSLLRVKDFNSNLNPQPRHEASAELITGDISIRAKNTQDGFSAGLSIQIPRHKVKYKYDRDEVGYPYDTLHTSHKLQFIGPDNRSVYEFEHTEIDTHTLTPLNTTSQTTTLSNSYHLTPNLHIGLKLKTDLKYPTPQQTQQGWYWALRARWRDFYRVIWDEDQNPYPREPQSDTVVELSSRGHLKLKYWGIMDNYSPIETANNHILAGYLNINPFKPYYIGCLKPDENALDAGISYTYQNIESTGFSTVLYAKLCGYLKLLAAGSVPGLPALSWRLSATCNVFNPNRPSFGADLIYNTEHRLGYDTLLTPRGFVHYRLPVLHRDEYDPRLNYSDVITRWHEQQLAMFYSDTDKEEYLRQQTIHYASLLFPEDQLHDCTEDEFSYIVHDDEFIKHHPVLSQLPYKMAKTYHYRDPETKRIVMPSAFALKRYQQRRIYPYPIDHHRGDVTPPRFYQDEIENMFYWGWFLRKKDTHLPETIEEIASDHTYRLWMSMYRYESLLKALNRLEGCQEELNRVLQVDNEFIAKQQQILMQQEADINANPNLTDEIREASKAKLNALYQQQIENKQRQQSITYNINDLQNHVHFLRHREEFQVYLNEYYDKKSDLDKKKKWAHLNNVSVTDEAAMKSFDELDLMVDSSDPSNSRYYFPEEVYLRNFHMFNQRYEQYLAKLQKQYQLTLVKDYDNSIEYYLPTNSEKYDQMVKEIYFAGLQDHSRYYQTSSQWDTIPALQVKSLDDDIFNISKIGNVAYRKILSYYNDIDRIRAENKKSIPAHPLQFPVSIDGSSSDDMDERIRMQQSFINDILFPIRNTIVKQAKLVFSNFFSIPFKSTPTPIQIDDTVIHREPSSVVSSIFASVFNREESNRHLHSLANHILDKHIAILPKVVDSHMQSTKINLQELKKAPQTRESVLRTVNLHNLPTNLSAFLSLDEISAKHITDSETDLNLWVKLQDEDASLQRINSGQSSDPLQLPDELARIQHQNQILFAELQREEQDILISHQLPFYVDDGMATASAKSPVIHDLIETQTIVDQLNPEDLRANASSRLIIKKRPIPQPFSFQSAQSDPTFSPDREQLLQQNDFSDIVNNEIDSNALNRVVLTKDHVAAESTMRLTSSGLLPEEEYNDQMLKLAKKRDMGLFNDEDVQSERQHRLKTRLEAQIALAKLTENEKRLENMKLFVHEQENQNEMKNYYENVLLAKDIYPMPYTVEYELDMSSLDAKLREIHGNLTKLEDKLLEYDKKVLEYQVRALEHPTNQMYFDAYNKAMKDREDISKYYNDERKHIEKLENELLAQKTSTTFRYLHRDTLLDSDEMEKHNIASQERYKQSILRAIKEEELLKKEIVNSAFFGVENYISKNPIEIASDINSRKKKLIGAEFNQQEIDAQLDLEIKDSMKKLHLSQREAMLDWYSAYKSQYLNDGNNPADMMTINDFIDFKYHELLEDELKVSLLRKNQSPSLLLSNVDENGYQRDSDGNIVVGMNPFAQIAQSDITQHKLRQLESQVLLQDQHRQHGYYPHHIRDQLEVPDTMLVPELARDDPRFRLEPNVATLHDILQLRNKYLEPQESLSDYSGISTLGLGGDPTAVMDSLQSDGTIGDQFRRHAALHTHDPMQMKPELTSNHAMTAQMERNESLRSTAQSGTSNLPLPIDSISRQENSQTPRRRRNHAEDQYDYLLAPSVVQTPTDSRMTEYIPAIADTNSLNPTQATYSRQRYNLSKFGASLEQHVHNAYHNFESPSVHADLNYHSPANDRYVLPTETGFDGKTISGSVSTPFLSQEEAFKMYKEFDHIGNLYHLSEDDVQYLRDNVHIIWDMQQRTGLEREIEEERIQKLRQRKIDTAAATQAQKGQEHTRRGEFIPAHKSTILQEATHRKTPQKVGKETILHELQYHADTYNPELYTQFEYDLKQRGIHPDMIYTNRLHRPQKTQPERVWEANQEATFYALPHNHTEIQLELEKSGELPSLMSPTLHPYAAQESTINANTFNRRHQIAKMSQDPDFVYKKHIPRQIIYEEHNKGANHLRDEKLAALRRNDGGSGWNGTRNPNEKGSMISPGVYQTNAFKQMANPESYQLQEEIYHQQRMAQMKEDEAQQNAKKNKLFGDSSRAYFSDASVGNGRRH